MPICIYKVRAHTGVLGNTASDELANLAHDLPLVPVTYLSAAGANGRSAHWIQNALDGSGSAALDRHGTSFTLNDHGLGIAQTQHRTSK